MRQAGLRELSKSDLIKIAEMATAECHAARVRHGRLLRRWWWNLAVVAAASFVAGIAITWLVAR